jgi:hypothetical protein
MGVNLKSALHESDGFRLREQRQEIGLNRARSAAGRPTRPMAAESAARPGPDRRTAHAALPALDDEDAGTDVYCGLRPNAKT